MATEQELRAAVAAEVRVFFQHMRDVRPAYNARTVDELFDDTLDWYLGEHNPAAAAGLGGQP